VAIDTVLNPKLTSEMATSKKVQDVAKKLFEVINSESTNLTRIEIIQLLKNLNKTFLDKIEDLAELEWKTQTLIKKIKIADSYMELRDIHAELNETQKSFFSMLPSVGELMAVCTEYRDLITKKIINFVIQELINQSVFLPEESFAYLSLGSDARMEQTLITDQDNLVVFEDSKSRYKDVYYERFSELLVERLSFCGFKKCSGGIMPSNKEWRGGLSEWMERVEDLCRFKAKDYKKNLVNLISLTDLRFIYGDEELAQRFITSVYRRIFDNQIVLNEIAKSAASLGVAKGFMRTLKTEKKGAFKGMINIKLHAWAPLILAIRAFAMKNRVMETGTIKRIDALVQAGAFSKEDGALLKRDYYLITRLKVTAQVYYLNGKSESEHYLNPNDMTKKEKEELLDALSDIEKIQKLLIESMGLRI